LTALSEDEEMLYTYLGRESAAVLLLACFVTMPAAEGQKTTNAVQAPWSPAKAWIWYKNHTPIRGCNYLPRTAVNDTEMWQSETFDPRTMDQELGWAEQSGYNSLRVFLQYIVWEQEPDAFKKRIDDFLAIAKKHSLTVTFVLFDDCAFAGKDPYLGKQEDPVPGVHNSGWVPSPGRRRVIDRRYWPKLKEYVTDLVGAYGGDPRVLAWDLYNEPGNSGMGEKSEALVNAAFDWARLARPSQPLTVGVWEPNSSMLGPIMELSDIVSFHGYGPPKDMTAIIEICRKVGRPVVCTEWLRRQVGCTFAAILPIFAKYDVGWYNWGLVAGRTQTYMSWGSKEGDPMPRVWQHDMFHPDGAPYDPAEINLIRHWQPQ
jgi:hypothetical protein